MSKAPSSIVGIDLGNNTLKAVRLQRRGSQYILTRVSLIGRDGGGPPPETLTEQYVASRIKELSTFVKISGADVHFTINAPNSTVRYVELPNIPLDEMRSALKLNSATYLRQNFENYTFDACPLDSEASEALARRSAKAKRAAGGGGKLKLLVGGIASSEVVLYYHAARRAGSKPISLQLAPISLMNGFAAAFPAIFHNQAIALLDLGYLTSTLTILDKGTPLLTRAVPIGGKHITEYMAQTGGMDLGRAEAAKIQGDPSLGEAVTRTTVTLIREIRSSINFFEKNSDQPISKVYLTGGSVRSPAVVEALNNDIGTTCEVWNAAEGLTLELPPEQQNLFSKGQPSFSAALGATRTYASAMASGTAPAPAAPTAATA